MVCARFAVAVGEGFHPSPRCVFIKAVKRLAGLGEGGLQRDFHHVAKGFFAVFGW